MTRIATLLAGMLLAGGVVADKDDIYRLQSIEDRDYNEVLETLQQTLINRGIVLTYHAHAGDMLSRTGADVGLSTPYAHADILGFCKVGLSHDMVNEDDRSVLMCPYSIATYQREGENEPVMIGYTPRTSLVDSKSSRAIDELLQEIVDEVIEGGW